MDSIQFVLENIFTTAFLFTVLRVTTPILFAALASVISSKAGVPNIALEGIMLTAALFGVLGSGMTQSLFLGVLFGLFGGLVITLILAYFGLYLKTDIILAGIALNMLAIGGTVFLLYVVSGDRGVSAGIPSLVFPSFRIPIIDSIPILGPILSGHNVLTYLSLILVFVVYILLYKTRYGLRLRSVGENKIAAESIGIKVRRVQLSALVLGGIIASFGGMYMSMGYLSNFSRNMISGRGYIALAADAMGQSSPVGTLFSSIIFGSAESISYLLQSLAIPGEIIRTIPYAVTILGLIIYSVLKRKNDIKRRKKLEYETREAA